MGSNTEMIAVEFGRKTFGYGGIESEPESLVDGGEETIRRPAVFEEKKLHARAITAFTKDIARAKNFGDGTHDGDDLVGLYEGVKANGEVRLRREAAGDAEGKAEFVSCDLRLVTRRGSSGGMRRRG